MVTKAGEKILLTYEAFFVYEVTFSSRCYVMWWVSNLLPSWAQILWNGTVLLPFGFLLIFYGQSILSSVQYWYSYTFLVLFIQVPCIDRFALRLKNMHGHEQSCREALGHCQIHLSCLIFIEGHASPSDIPCLSRCW